MNSTPRRLDGTRPPAEATAQYHALAPQAYKALEAKFPMDSRSGQEQLLIQLGQQMVLREVRNGFAVS